MLSAATVLVGAGMSAEARARSRQDIVVGDDRAAADDADRAAHWAPWSADAALLRAQTRVGARSTAEELALAEADADRAVWLAPSRAAAREVRARLRARSGDLPGAFADLAAATAFHPLRGEYSKRKAEIAAALPRPAGAGPPR
jgi:hypothetical protein